LSAVSIDSRGNVKGILDRWSASEVGKARSLVRFICVGLGSTAIHFAVAVTLVSLLQLPAALANALAVLVATVFSYLVNTLWSFSSSIGARTVSRFILVSALVAAFAAVVSGVFERFGVDYRLGIFATVVAIPPLTFWLHHTWTYRVD
jgi:putative flippase GtrA